MGYQKFQANAIFTGEDIVYDQVLVMNEKGQFDSFQKKTDAGEDVQQLVGLLTPGFINVHCHLELSHLFNKIPKHTGLIDFVFKIVSERESDQELILEKIESAEKEMIENGIVAVGDICNNQLTLLQKKKRNLFYYNFIEVSGWHPDVAAIRFEKSKQIYEAFVATFPETSMVPHAPYSVSDKLWHMLSETFSGKTITVHNQETEAENKFFKTGGGDLQRMYELMKIDNSFFIPSGKTSLSTYFEKMSLASRMILVHNTFISEDDLAYTIKSKVNKADIYFCLCVNANLFIENKLPPVEMLVENKCKIVLGTDSLASNDQLNILEEIKTIQKHFPRIPLTDLLKYATINGAQALGIDNTFGSFEAGKKPGVLLIDEFMGDTISPSSRVKRIL